MILHMHVLTLFQVMCLSALGYRCPNLEVRQMPESVHVEEGADVHLNCIVAHNVNDTILATVEWFTNSSKLEYARYNITGKQNVTVVLSLLSVSRNQSGKYSCNVSLLMPCFIKSSGNGTILTVEVLKSPGTVAELSSFTIMWTSLLAVVFLVGTSCVIYCKRKGNNITATTGGETDCPIPVPQEVLYTKLNIKDSNDHDRGNNRQTQNGNEPQVGKKTLNSGCLRPTVEENVLYSTLKPAPPDLEDNQLIINVQ
ncbi:hypothetical protein AAFF_G00022940 [Aldrovandia affinis]|uniref:Ig-like domain-containing protein n=1 Tax=Aldrovandia affinis TaxID=143900 RepID=A0AAD7T743_9TELE|nr:hypothetical protein AAFF_G00022940 [Aldrovandia affinis]